MPLWGGGEGRGGGGGGGGGSRGVFLVVAEQVMTSRNIVGDRVLFCFVGQFIW